MESSNPYPVEPAGFFFGCLLACVLYGAHVAQVYSYFDTSSRSTSVSLYHRCLVIWVLGLSTVHMFIVWSASYRYFVTGLGDKTIWGEFYWVLSVQDGVIPLMAATAQYYFGRRAWLLTGRKTWVAAFVMVMPTITLAFGVGLAITAKIWSGNPWVSADDMHSRPIGVPSQIVAIAWMGLSAITDGVLSVLLVWCFVRARRASHQWSTRKIAKRLIALTLETVLLTHVVGAVMCILFLSAPAEHRTKNNLFWVLLEIILELYALSILFTIIHHDAIRRTMRADHHHSPPSDPSSTKAVHEPTIDMGQTALDRRVEGFMPSPTDTMADRIYIPTLGMPTSTEAVNDQSYGSSGSGGLTSPGSWLVTPTEGLSPGVQQAYFHLTERKGSTDTCE